MSADRSFLLLSYFTPHLWQQASIPMISFLITSLVFCLSRQTIVRSTLVTAPNPQKDKNKSGKEKDDIDPFLRGVQSGIPREQNEELTTT